MNIFCLSFNRLYSTKNKILDIHSLSFDYSEISVVRYRAWFGTKRSQVRILHLRQNVCSVNQSGQSNICYILYGIDHRFKSCQYIKNVKSVRLDEKPITKQHGRVAQWLIAADCKSALVRVRWFESTPSHREKP